MFVKIQLIADDGKTIIYEQVGNASCAMGWEPVPGQNPTSLTGYKLPGFCYLPVPPSRDLEDADEVRRLVAEHFG